MQKRPSVTRLYRLYERSRPPIDESVEESMVNGQHLIANRNEAVCSRARDESAEGPTAVI